MSDRESSKNMSQIEWINEAQFKEVIPTQDLKIHVIHNKKTDKLLEKYKKILEYPIKSSQQDNLTEQISKKSTTPK